MAGFRCTALWFGLLLPALAHASFAPRWDLRRETPGAFRLLIEAGSLSSTQNFDATGSKGPTVISGDTLMSYKRLQTDIYGILGLSSSLSAYARVSWNSIKYETEELLGSAYGLTEQGLGLSLRVWESEPGRVGEIAKRRSALDFQFQLDLPAYNNEAARTAGNPLLGDATTDMTLGAFYTMPLSQGRGTRWTLLPGMGYTIRSGGFSAGVPYTFTIAATPERQGLTIRFGVTGFQALTSETRTTLLPTAAAVDGGGSYFVNALNSSYMAGRVLLGYQSSFTSTYYLQLTKSLSGKSAPDATAITLGLQWRMGNTGAARDSGSQAPKKSAGSKGFVNYSLVARVTKTNDRVNMLKIDKGSQDGVEVGQVFDIFSNKGDPQKAGELVARAQVTKVISAEAALKVTEYFKEVWIEEGFTARKLVRD